MMTWQIVQIPALAQARVVRGLREVGFRVVQPSLTVWKPRGKNEAQRTMKTPIFPGYAFLGAPAPFPFERLHDDPRLTCRIIPNGWPEKKLAELVYDFCFRELAGEFDKTGEDTYRPAKPATGPLNKTLGNGMDCLGQILTRSESGRLDLLFSGELVDSEPLDEPQAA